MLFTILTVMVLLLLGPPVLFLLGRHGLNSLIRNNNAAHEKVAQFLDYLSLYARSSGDDGRAFGNLLRHTSEVEGILGYDNYQSSLHMGRYLLNGAPILPLALHEMQRHFSDFVFRKDAVQTAAALESVLLMHLGKREVTSRLLDEQNASIGGCIAYGWTRLAALPISVLRAFDLVSATKADRAQSSLLFRIWSFVLAAALTLAAIAGPVLSFLADRDAIERQLRDFTQ